MHEKVATGAPLSFSNPEGNDFILLAFWNLFAFLNSFVFIFLEPGLTFGLVRSDTHDNNWYNYKKKDSSYIFDFSKTIINLYLFYYCVNCNRCIFGYADAADKKNLVVKGTGNGGLAEMKENFEKDNVNYGLHFLILFLLFWIFCY